VPGFGPIEIHEVNAIGALLDPLSGNDDRVVVENRFLGIIALPQPNCAATPKIDRGINVHAPPLSAGDVGKARSKRYRGVPLEIGRADRIAPAKAFRRNPMPRHGV
jgi:hypothetical protein